MLDMVGFLLMVFILLLACQDFFYFKKSLSQGVEPSLHTYMQSLCMQFRILLFGDFTDTVDGYDFLEFIMFAVFSIIVIVVFMNLLIAIISDSFDKVWQQKSKRSMYQLCELVEELAPFKCFTNKIISAFTS